MTIEPKLMSDAELAEVKADVEYGSEAHESKLLAHISALDLTVASLTEELRTSQSAWFAERAEASKTVECLKEQLAEVAGVVGEIEARTVEAIAAWLESHWLGTSELFAAQVRAGAWRPR